MKLLLDTPLLIWGASSPHRLSKQARSLVEDPGNELHFSAASIWDIAIKYALGRDKMVIDPRVLRRGLLDHGYTELLITSEQGIGAGSLPQLHKDPFDRLLVAQAIHEGITVLTADPVVAKYSGPIRKV